MLGQGGLGLPNLAALGIIRAIPVQNIAVGIFNNAQSFSAPTLALEAAQNIAPGLFNEGDTFHQPVIDVEALPGQLLIQFFDEGDSLYPPAVALEAAKAVSIAYFDEGDQFYAPAVFGETTDLAVTLGRLVNVNEFYGPQIVVAGKAPEYTYPIGRGLYSDYGIRASMTNYKRRLIIGNRR